MSKVVFKASISHMGDNRIIWIPTALHEMIKSLEGKQVKVTLE